MSINDRTSFDASRRFQMRRRDFLTVGSAAVVGAMTTNLPAAVTRAVQTRTNATQLSIGFWDGATSSGRIQTAALRAPISAEALPMGDPRFLSVGARVGVIGLWRAASHRGTPLAVTVSAWYDVAGVGKVPVVLSSYSDNRQGVTGTGLARALVPVDATGALEISIDAIIPAVASRTGAPEAHPMLSSREELAKNNELVSFKLNFDRGMKLQQGLYIVAVQQQGARVPDWSSFAIADLKNAASLTGDGPLTESRLFGTSAPEFDYLLLSVEIAS
jgi:hypothetical protein